MATTKINVAALYGALNAARESRDLSWRQVAKEIGVSPSLLSRMANGYRPDADGFATLVKWLGMSAEHFMMSEGDEVTEPEWTAQLAPLLRANKDLDADDVKYIEEVIQATLRRARAARLERP
jgi:transcriptional regulator with XRE-family HTH domain